MKPASRTGHVQWYVRRHFAMIGVLALVTVASAGALGWQLTGSPAVAVGSSASLDGLTAAVHRAEWVAMDHVMDGQGGFLMPDEMMPGAPSGDEMRLGLGITLANPDDRTHRFDLVNEFTLVGGRESEPRRLRADTIGDLARLGPGTAVDGTLYFDIELPDAGDPPLYLRWTRGQHTVRIPVTPSADPPAHQHG